MKFIHSIGPLLASTAVQGFELHALSSRSLDFNSTISIKHVAKNIVKEILKTYYTGTAEKFVDLPPPYYWWECGALMGSLLDYSHYTNDTSQDPLIAKALLDQTGPNYDYMLPRHYGDEGNDDLAFWGFNVMAAAERNFPQPEPSIPPWLDMGANIWGSLLSRWNTSACGGGLLWQIFPTNPNGLNYRASVANGGFFQLSARLARATGNQTYLEWADKVWDWMNTTGLIDRDFNVLDGADSRNNCTAPNKMVFSYSQGIFLYGAAVLADTTNSPVWADRAARLLQASRSFFTPFDNATNIMYERACETIGTCDTDMMSFKAYLSRFMWATAALVPDLRQTVTEIMETSARAAARACDGSVCGQKWYVGGFDGNVGLGQQMSVLEAVQGLLAERAELPLKGDDIQVVRTFEPDLAGAGSLVDASNGAL